MPRSPTYRSARTTYPETYSRLVRTNSHLPQKRFWATIEARVPLEPYQSVYHRANLFTTRARSLNPSKPSKFEYRDGDLLVARSLAIDGAQTINLKLVPDPVQQTKPGQALYKQLTSSVANRSYNGTNVQTYLGDRIAKFFPRDEHKKILRHNLLVNIPRMQKRLIPVLDLFKALFAERAPTEDLDKLLADCEPRQNVYNRRGNKRLDNLMSNYFSKGAFYEYRAELALEYLKASRAIIDYKHIPRTSYLDRSLGIDFLVKACIDGREQLMAIQVKSSADAFEKFSSPKKLLWYNMRNGLERNTQVKRQGMALIEAGGKSLTQIAGRIESLINNPSRREELGIKTIDTSLMPKSLKPSLREIKNWLRVLETNFIDNQGQV